MKGAVKFQYVTTESNPADLLTKPLAVLRHEQLLQLTDSLHLTPTTEDPNTMNEADYDLGKEGAVR